MKTIVKLTLLVVAGIVIFNYWPARSPETEPRVPDPKTQRETRAGPVIGTADADNTYAWLGIPFAAPPLKDLRWSAPHPVELWRETRQVVGFRDLCVQLSGPLDGLPEDSGPIVGSEDCLYLNIWSPQAHSSADGTKLPVMFWIHGGGNTIGTANTYNGSKLASGEQVVVVTINYRLGFFGWMSHPALRIAGRDPLDSSGNYANLDMIAALTWVQDNIGNFGGDPDNVTIFGESAGGLNVFTLMASPLASGLFHQAIAQSGSVGTTPRWRAENFQNDPEPGEIMSSREWLSLQLQNTGRATDPAAARAAQELMSDIQTRDFMYSLSAEQILEGISGGAGMYSAPQSIRDGTVLPLDSLFTLFLDPARYNSVPLITGSNRDEAKLFLAQSPEFVERRFGFLPRIIDEQAYNALSAYLSDNWKATAVDGTADLIAANGGKPVFAYRWDWDEGGKSFLVDYRKLLGAAHGLEVAYIFDSFEGGIMAPGLYTDENIPGRDLLAAQMRGYWSEFARTGSPNKGRDGTQTQWTQWTTSAPNLMRLDTEADGGLQLVKEPMTTAMLKQRLSEDQNIPDLHSRCSLHVQLFLLANAGDDVWDEAEYEVLGCAEFDPWSLDVSP